MSKSSVGHLVEQGREAFRFMGVWAVVILVIAGPYIFWFLLRP